MAAGAGGPTCGSAASSAGSTRASTKTCKHKDLKAAYDQNLDEAVFAAYGWDSSLTDEEILARLLALNLERAQGGGGESSSARASE